MGAEPCSSFLFFFKERNLGAESCEAFQRGRVSFYIRASLSLSLVVVVARALSLSLSLFLGARLASASESDFLSLFSLSLFLLLLLSFASPLEKKEKNRKKNLRCSFSSIGVFYSLSLPLISPFFSFHFFFLFCLSSVVICSLIEETA